MNVHMYQLGGRNQFIILCEEACNLVLKLKGFFIIYLYIQQLIYMYNCSSCIFLYTRVMIYMYSVEYMYMHNDVCTYRSCEINVER